MDDSALLSTQTEKDQQLAARIEELGRLLQLPNSNNSFHSHDDLKRELRECVDQLLVVSHG